MQLRLQRLRAEMQRLHDGKQRLLTGSATVAQVVDRRCNSAPNVVLLILGLNKCAAAEWPGRKDQDDELCPARLLDRLPRRRGRHGVRNVRPRRRPV
jgi:hypothetical protein